MVFTQEVNSRFRDEKTKQGKKRKEEGEKGRRRMWQNMKKKDK